MARMTIDQLGKIQAAIRALDGFTNDEMIAFIDTLVEENDGLAAQLADAITTELDAKAFRDNYLPEHKAIPEGNAEAWGYA